jgi:hypothetical protein
MWQNNMLKYYLEKDIDKACDYGEDLLTDFQDLLTLDDLLDLKFTLGVIISFNHKFFNDILSFRLH